MKVYVAGFPNRIGGANSELWHTIKLWLKHGLDVTVFPTWMPDVQWKNRLEQIGCQTMLAAPGDLVGKTVVAMSNSEVMSRPEVFRGARIVWAPCCSYLSNYETEYYRKDNPLFVKYLFQSQYQQAALWPEYQRLGVHAFDCHMIHGAFDAEEFPYHPLHRRVSDKFVIGRMSRPHPWKFRKDTWEVFGAIRDAIDAPVSVRVMGYKSFSIPGAVPSWAEVLPMGEETPQKFLASLHAMVQLTEKPENWPRTGLEAMSAGVPVITNNAGGWQEMIHNGQTGFLCDTTEEVVAACKSLAEDGILKNRIASLAREVIDNEIAEPEMIWHQWERLFESIT